MPKLLLSDDERRDLLETMTNEELRTGVLEGHYYIAGPSDTPGKPMVRHALGPLKGRPVKGTGAVKGSAANMAIVSKDYAYKRTANWRVLVEEYWGPKLPQLFKYATDMMEGGMVSKTEKVSCPCGCDYTFPVTVEMYKKGDAQALKVVWEAIIGRATERKEVDINIRSLIARIDAREDTNLLEIVDLTPDEVAERMALANRGEVEAQWRERVDEA